MTSFWYVVLVIVNVITLLITVLYVFFYLYDWICGSEDAGKLLKKLHIPLSYRQAVIIGNICLVIYAITYALDLFFFRQT